MIKNGGEDENFETFGSPRDFTLRSIPQTPVSFDDFPIVSAMDENPNKFDTS